MSFTEDEVVPERPLRGIYKEIQEQWNEFNNVISSKIDNIETLVFEKENSMLQMKDTLAAECYSIEASIQKLKEEKFALDKEIQTRKDMLSTKIDLIYISPDNDDLVKLYVRGNTYEIERSTLCQIPNSLLSEMFSSDSDSSLSTNDDGYIHLSLEKEYFDLLIKYLSRRKYNPNFALPVLEGYDGECFEDFCIQLGIVPTDKPMNLIEVIETTNNSEVIHNSEIISEENFETINLEYLITECSFLAGSYRYNNGIVIWRLQRKNLQGELFFGVIDDNSLSTNVLGWKLKNGRFYRVGGPSNIKDPTETYKPDTKGTITLQLDMVENKLFIHMHFITAVMSVKRKGTYRLCITENTELSWLAILKDKDDSDSGSFTW